MQRRTMLLSAAVMAALGSASPLALAADQTMNVDVCIVGAGAGGVSAGMASVDAGFKTVILEKLGVIGGGGNYMEGTFAVGSRLQLKDNVGINVEKQFKRVMDFHHWRINGKALNNWLKQTAATIDWMEQHGIKFEGVHTAFIDGNRTWHMFEGGHGSSLIKNFAQKIEAKGGQILTSTPAQSLIIDKNGTVTGVIAKNEDGDKITINAKAVIIATGGFSGNPEMVDRYIGGWATRMVLRGSPAITGENISLTLPLFTKFVNMDQFHSGPIIGKTHVNPADVLNSGYGIQVNTSGNRYMDENNTYVIKARTTAQMTLDNTAWVIVDSDCSVLDKVIPKFDRLNSPYGKADTIEELCKQVGLPAEKVKKLVDEYNEKMKAGKLGEMNPPCTYKKPHPIAKAPFYAVPLQGGMTATFGGPLINTKTEIQNLDGKSIPGLYAAGNSAGGIFFHNYAGGAQLGAATVFGRVAGVEMANRAKKAAKK